MKKAKAAIRDVDSNHMKLNEEVDVRDENINKDLRNALHSSWSSLVMRLGAKVDCDF